MEKGLIKFFIMSINIQQPNKKMVPIEPDFHALTEHLCSLTRTENFKRFIKFNF